MAKKKRAKRKFTIPLAPIAGLAAGMALPIQRAMEGNVEAAAWHMVHNYTGVDMNTGAFDVKALAVGIVPLVIGLLVHKFVGGAPLNLNRTLATAGVPVIRI